MSRRERCIKLILPTEPLIRKYEMHLPLLSKVSSDWQSVSEYIMARWLDYHRESRRDVFPVSLNAFEYVYGDARLDIIDSAVGTLEADDVKALRIVLRSFIRKFFDTVIALIDQFHLSDYQVQTLKVDSWLGHSLVLCVYS